MSLSSLFNNLDKYIIEDQWLQFVGYMFIAGGLIGIGLNTAHTFLDTLPLGIAFVGLGVSMAGWLYHKIYP